MISVAALGVDAWLARNTEPEPNSGCWIWIGTRNRKGYGQVNLHRPRHNLAHRATYTMFRGEIGDEMEIDHRCRNTSCVNPRHLEVVAGVENNRRKRRSTCGQGHPKKTSGVKASVCRVCARGWEADWRERDRRKRVIDSSVWASVPYGNRNAFRDFVGTHYLWHRALVEQIFAVTGTSVALLPIGEGGGPEWLLAVQRQYEAEAHALGLAAPPDLSSYDLSDQSDFASWTFLLSQQATILATAAGLP